MDDNTEERARNRKGREEEVNLSNNQESNKLNEVRKEQEETRLQRPLANQNGIVTFFWSCFNHYHS